MNAGALDLLDVVDLDALADPDVAAQADARDVQPHALVERVEVRLPELVEVADVLPVAVAARSRTCGRPISSSSGKSSFEKSYGRSVGTCLSTSGSST